MVIIHGKAVVFAVSLSEKRYDLPGEDLKKGKCGYCQDGSRSHGFQIGAFDTLVFLRAEVEAGDGLQALGDSDDKAHKEHVYL